ncbi:MAG TPA: GGDEF domain-containing protein, partial [Steroidobacteraceae bacterium]|nr:GGDEF domain-containing protein [Steroidobacteraceae bacterium]
WGRYQRHRRPFAVIILDLDGFKQVNDRFGHQTGDRSLQWLAAHLRRCSRQGDIAARLGGDEFALLLPETAADAARVVLDRLRTDVGSDRTLIDRRTGDVVDLRISGGVATPDERTSDADYIVHAADTQLYARKAERSAHTE